MGYSTASGESYLVCFWRQPCNLELLALSHCSSQALLPDSQTPTSTILINTTLALIHARLQHLATTLHLEDSLIPTIERLAGQLHGGQLQDSIASQPFVTLILDPAYMDRLVVPQLPEPLIPVRAVDQRLPYSPSSNLSTPASMRTLSDVSVGSSMIAGSIISRELKTVDILSEDALRRRNRVLERQVRDARKLVRTARILLNDVIESGKGTEGWVKTLSEKVDRMQDVLLSDLDVRAGASPA